MFKKEQIRQLNFEIDFVLCFNSFDTLGLGFLLELDFCIKRDFLLEFGFKAVNEPNTG